MTKDTIYRDILLEHRAFYVILAYSDDLHAVQFHFRQAPVQHHVNEHFED